MLKKVDSDLDVEQGGVPKKKSKLRLILILLILIVLITAVGAVVLMRRGGEPTEVAGGAPTATEAIEIDITTDTTPVATATAVSTDTPTRVVQRPTATSVALVRPTATQVTFARATDTPAVVIEVEPTATAALIVEPTATAAIMIEAPATSIPDTPEPTVATTVTATVAKTRVYVPPTALPYAPPVLANPRRGTMADNADLILSWYWERELRADEWFDVRLARRGTPLRGIAWTKDTRYVLTEPLFSDGNYQWQVVIIRGKGVAGERQVVAELTASAVKTFDWTK